MRIPTSPLPKKKNHQEILYQVVPVAIEPIIKHV
jgi:hypothetical protein